MTINEILTDIRAKSFNTADKGTRFETVILNYFLTEPIFADQLDHAWLWNDFPYRQTFGGHDIGIDVVCRTKSNEYWAIQCKCYDKGTTIDKSAVDSFISTSGKTFIAGQEKQQFSRRYWVDSLAGSLNKNAEIALQNQTPSVQRLGLDSLNASTVDWEKIYKGKHGSEAQAKKKTLRDDQKEAISKAKEHYCTNERGKMIMACGTGKTFTSLRLAEAMTNHKGTVLFLVPSISLLSQTLMAWTSDAEKSITPICICSDSKASSKKSFDDSGALSVEQLAEPATTDVNKIRDLIQAKHTVNPDGMLVVFSTYQSIEVISNAQKAIGDDFIFDLIICDEAHRTTGVTLENEEESAFVRVHDNDFIKGKKRVYMTATPRLYRDADKEKANAVNSGIYLCSMDDEKIYGKEFYRLSFKDAVDKGLLADYKVVILTMNKNLIDKIPADTDDTGAEEHIDVWKKLVGTVAALSKISLNDDTTLYKDDPQPMRRAVAFCTNIKTSLRIKNSFNVINKEYADLLDNRSGRKYVQIESRHVDGTQNVQVRNEAIQWLKDTPEDSNNCRILCNVRCLSEGVDVPSLDAAIFLSPRKSEVEIVQSVGRVMRRSAGKKFGYLIIPVVVEPGKDADKALDKCKDFQIVWSVARALRSHDDRFSLYVNNPDTNLSNNSINPSSNSTNGNSGTSSGNTSTPIVIDGDKFDFPSDELETKFYARMVQKVGDRRYWVQWAEDIAKIASRHIKQLTKRIDTDKISREKFDEFLDGLHKNINDSITKQAAIEMIAQHIITKPVFESLFDGAEFIANNPISKSMQIILDIINLKAATSEEEDTLNHFYDSVKDRAKAVRTAEGRQKIIVELYDSFFKNAFPKMVEQLGIVYTPVEVVDFIINSVSYVLRKEFGRTLSDEGVNIIDPFTGTGTFIVRLIQSGLIRPEDLQRKYEQELRANEIVLLAYYIASINIENAYHSIINEKESLLHQNGALQNKAKYTPFAGICLTDTFQLGETNTDLFSGMFPINSRRLKEQKEMPIHIVIGNPPYSLGQKSANDDAQNLHYPKLEEHIEKTYVAGSNAALSKTCYDSYIKAFRWATDRLDQTCGGIIGFVTNGSYLDNNGLDGFRKCIEKEFENIYVFNLRGNCRTSGELRRREGGNVFGIGTRTPVSITILVKKPNVQEKAVIKYYDIGDYLTREQKLGILRTKKSIENVDMTLLTPNEHGDWINLRNDEFAAYIPIEPEKKFSDEAKTFFTTFAIGVATNRDSWVYGYSKEAVSKNMQRMISFYNEQIQKLKDKEIIELSNDSSKISWTVNLRKDAEKTIEYKMENEEFIESNYRPFCKQNLYYHKPFIERPGIWKQLFPTKKTKNLVICVSGISGTKEFSCLLSNSIPDLQILFNGQCFPLYYYTEDAAHQATLFDLIDDNPDRFIRHDGISDWILKQAMSMYGKSVTKEDIFYYVYGFLHNQDYRTAYAADLKKMLPRIPLVENKADFYAFSKAGRQLADLHLYYETVEAAADVQVNFIDDKQDEYTYYSVEKMRYLSKGNKTEIIYNNHIRIKNIPPKAQEYIVNGKSALDWIMERYCVSTDKASGIKNDCNDWSREHKKPRYILDLILSVINVSCQTVDIVNSLPKTAFSPADSAVYEIPSNYGEMYAAESTK